jgi:hypothetical protein
MSVHLAILRSQCDTHVINCMCRMSLQSALIGFLISRLLPVPLSPREIVVVQTTAVATGTVRDPDTSSTYCVSYIDPLLLE